MPALPGSRAHRFAHSIITYYYDYYVFETGQLADEREENSISVHVTLGQSGTLSIRSTEMVEAKNFDLVPDVTVFQDVRGKNTAFAISWSLAQAQLVTCLSSQIMEMIEAENLNLVANGRNYCTARKCLKTHFQRYLWACSEYAAVTPSVGISNRCCLPFWT